MRDIHKVFSLLRTVFCAVIFLCTPALAQSSVYNIDSVEVDVSASNAVEAREKAFEEAQIKAFEELTERLLTEQERAAFVMPEIDVISGLVQDFEVTNEQLSAVRYKGVYTIRFRPSAVQNYLERSDMPYSDVTPSRPVLILPYIQVGVRTSLWQYDNPFMQAWSSAPSDKNTILPLGDLLDVTQAKDDPALRYDKMMLDKMAARYQADTVIIAIAEPLPNEDLRITLYDTENVTPRHMHSLLIPADTETMDSTVYDRAVQEIRAILKQEWKVQTQINPAQANHVRARAQFDNIQEWMRLKQSIENVSGVNSVIVQGLKPKEAIMRIEFAGSRERLNTVFAQAGLNLTPPNTINPYNAQLAGDIIYDINFTNGVY